MRIPVLMQHDFEKPIGWVELNVSEQKALIALLERDQLVLDFGWTKKPKEILEISICRKPPLAVKLLRNANRPTKKT